MIKFIIKLIKSLFQHQKFLAVLVLSGMILCSVLVVNFLYEMHLSAYTEEEIQSINNHVSVYYDDMSGLEDLIEYMNSESCIRLIMFKANVEADGEDCLALTYFGTWEGLDSYVKRGELLGMEDYGLVNVDYHYTERIEDTEEIGSVIKVQNREYQVMGILNAGQGNVNGTVYMTQKDLLELADADKLSGYIEYWYKGDTGKIKEINEYIQENSSPVSIEEAEKMNNFDLKTVFSEFHDILYTMLIAIIDYMLIYSYLLKKRMRQYGILKLIGVSDRKLILFMYLEMITYMIITFAVTMTGFYLYLRVTERTVYQLPVIYLYSAGFMLFLNFLVFFPVTWRFRRMTPFAFYRISE